MSSNKFTVVSGGASRRGTPPPSVGGYSTVVGGSGNTTVGGASSILMQYDPAMGDADSESEGEPIACPLCLEDMDASDCRFKPCPCGYQICRFCWHRIREEGNEKCPACRKVYTDEDIEFLPETEEMKAVKRASSRGSKRKETVNAGSANNSISLQSSVVIPSGVLASRRHLVDIRVIQKNLVYVIGISARIASENILRDPEYFGQFGKIIKIVVNRRNTGAPLPAEKISGAATTTSGSAYVTYSKAEEAARAISYVDGSIFDGRILRATYGTTKYCSFFLRDIPCPNAGCMYLHEEGESYDSYTKEELSSGKMHLNSHLLDQNSDVGTLKQFGTILYKPAPVRAAGAISPPAERPSSIVPTTIIINQNKNPNGNSAASTPPMVQTEQTSALLIANSAPAPEDLDKYQNMAQSFFDRISRWNRSCDLDLTADDKVRGTDSFSSTLPPLMLPTADEVRGDFDPFSASASSNALKSLRHWGDSEMPSTRPIETGFSLTTNSAKGPSITQGLLGGFDWQGFGAKSNQSVANPPPGGNSKASSLLLSGTGAMGEVVSFGVSRSNRTGTPVGPIGSPIGWKHSTSQSRPAPVLSPATNFQNQTQGRNQQTSYNAPNNSSFQGNIGNVAYGASRSTSGTSLTAAPGFENSFASPVPRMATHPSLEQLFAATATSGSNAHLSVTSNESSGAGKIDASQLEKQFFREGTGQSSSPPQNSIAPSSTLKNVTANPAGTVPVAISTFFGSSKSTVPVPNKIEAPSVTPNHAPTIGSVPSSKFSSENTAGSAAGKKVTSKTPAPAPILPPIVPTILRRPTAATGSGSVATSNAVGGTVTMGKTPTTSTVSKKAPTSKVVSLATTAVIAPNSKKDNLFAALAPEANEAASSDSEVEESKGVISSVAKPISGLAPSATASGSSKKNNSAPSSMSAPSTVVLSDKPGSVTILKRTDFPKFTSQPDYKPTFGNAENGYARLKLPQFSLMNEEERVAFRQWFQEDLRLSRLEEQQKREKVIKLRNEYISSFEHL